MQIYNPTNSEIEMPLTGSQMLRVPAGGTSEVFYCNKDFLSLLVTSFDYGELYLIVTGPSEVDMCSQVSCATGFVAYSVEEAQKDYEERKERK